MSGDLIASAMSAAVNAQARGHAMQLGPSAAPEAPGAAQAGRFAQAMDKIGGIAPSEMPKPVGDLFRALDGINVQAKSVADYARTAEASGGTMTPGEIVQLTMKCQEFAFQCQLTSNIANRSSDGVQQLFKQQG